MENEQARIRNMPESIHQADAYHVARAMTRGGGFLEALGQALLRADMDNRRRIYDIWGESIQREWNAYRRQGGW